MTIAEGEAQARVTAADAEAKSIEIVNKALASGAGPQLFALRQLDIEKARVEKWDGQYPAYYLGGGTSTGTLINIPIPTPATAK
jgi:hypothetical protein